MKLKLLAVTAMMGILFLAGCSPAPQSNNNPQPTQTQIPSQPTQPTQLVQDYSITSPDLSKPISSPLKLSGKITRIFVFEGVFPVALKDGNGKEIARSRAHIDPNIDISQVEMVPFTATLTFQQPATQTGTLVLENDNPSGLPENAQSRSIKVLFAQNIKGPCDPLNTWKNFKSAAEKVEFCYPPDFKKVQDIDMGMFITLSYPDSYFQGTNLKTATVDLSAVPDMNCLVGIADQKPLTKKVPKDFDTFYEDSWSEGAAGTLAENLGYYLEKNNLCYRFTLRMKDENLDNYKDENGKLPPGAPKEFDKNAVINLFKGIFGTLKIQ